jgi:REP element-mobilizing transposase RayT
MRQRFRTFTAGDRSSPAVAIGDVHWLSETLGQSMALPWLPWMTQDTHLGVPPVLQATTTLPMARTWSQSALVGVTPSSGESSIVKCTHPAIGAIVQEEWKRTAQLRSGVMLDAFVLMPNHLHGIVILNLQNDLAGGGMQRTRGLAVPSRGIGAIMSGFKAAVSSAIANQELGVSGPVWQRGFHDRIIRDERELQQFREYIANNALQWELDGYFEQEIGGP